MIKYTVYIKMQLINTLNENIHNHLTVSSLLTRCVVMHQEGTDEVRIDVVTVHRIGLHNAHVCAERCHTAHNRTKTK